MPHCCSLHPMPVLCADDAELVFSLARSEPPRHETLAFLLDPHGIGGVVVVVTNTVSPDALLEVVEGMVRCRPHELELDRLVVQSVRPHLGLLPGDIDRWLEASDVAAQQGALLVDWYVHGAGGVECPRDLLGEPERW